MNDIFQKAGKEYIPSRDNERIAEKIDVHIIAKNNKSFDRFREQVKDP